MEGQEEEEEKEEKKSNFQKHRVKLVLKNLLTCKTGQFLPKTANRLSSDPFLCAKIVKNGQCCRNFDSASNDVIPQVLKINIGVT